MNTITVTDRPTRVHVTEGAVSVLTVGTQGPPGVTRPGTVTWAATCTIDWSVLDTARVTLDGDTTFVFVGAAPGQKLMLELTQDSTGARAVTWPGNVRYSGTLPGIALSTAPAALDLVGFIYREGTTTYDLVAISTGY